jgi:hypothetical protein
MAGNDVLAEILESRRGVMTQREREFADSLLSFWKHQGRWTEKQINGAQKLVVRIILERDTL